MNEASLEKDGSSLLLEKVSENLHKVMPKFDPFNHWLYNRVLLDETVDELLKITTYCINIRK